MKFENFECYKLTVGLNDKDLYAQIVGTNDAENQIRNLIVKNDCGCTISHSIGAWADEFGNVTKEVSLVIEINGTDDFTIENICDEIKVLLNQNCIMVEKTVRQIAFV